MKGYDIFRSLNVIVNSQKDEGKAVKEHILKGLVSRGFDAKIKEIQRDDCQRETQTQQAITDCDTQIQTIQHESFGLQTKSGQKISNLKNAKIPSTILENVMLITWEIQVKIKSL